MANRFSDPAYLARLHAATIGKHDDKKPEGAAASSHRIADLERHGGEGLHGTADRHLWRALHNQDISPEEYRRRTAQINKRDYDEWAKKLRANVRAARAKKGKPTG